MRLTRVFLDSDLRCQFDGLRQIASDAETVLKNTFVVFINRKRTKFKAIVNDQYLVFYSNGDKRIPLDALIHLPATFGGSDLEMTQAISKTLNQGKIT